MTKALGKEGSFAEGPSNSPRQRFFLGKILKISLPMAREEALGKKNSKKKQFLCRGSALGKETANGTGARRLLFFAECLIKGPRQRPLRRLKIPRAVFAESSPRQSLCRGFVVLCRGPCESSSDGCNNLGLIILLKKD